MWLTDLFFKGVPPIVGGVYDQDNWFMESAAFLKREQDALKPVPKIEN
jgi:hypothetical protein